MTARQAARRERILGASALLAARGGFEAVQMREVAEEAHVALGTLYRYFPSKVHLLVATMQDHLDRLRATLRESPPAGATPGQRVASTLMRAFAALQREPQLADAMVRALTFADRSVNAEVEQVGRCTTAIVLEAMGTPAAADPGPALLSAVRVVEHTWHAALIAWLTGRAGTGEVRTDLETVCALLDRHGPGPDH